MKGLSSRRRAFPPLRNAFFLHLETSFVHLGGASDVVLPLFCAPRATLDDRLALSSAEYVEHPPTGEHILSGVRLRA